MSNVRKSIALINAQYSFDGKYDRPPVALIYLGSALRKAGYNVKIFHVVSKQDVNDTIKTISELPNLLFIGFSVYMGVASIISLKMSQICKTKFSIPIVWGGKFPSSISDQVLKESCLDVVCIGEAEKTIVALAKALETNMDLSTVKGIAYRDQYNSIVNTQQQDPIEDLDTLDYNLSIIEDWTPYIINKHGKKIIIDCFESQRGCPFGCSFCYQTEVRSGETRRVRSHSVEYIVTKVKELRELTGVDRISFCDDEFWINQKRSFAVMEELKNNGVTFQKLRMRFDSLKDENMLKRILDLNVVNLNFGMESGTNRILKLMNKRQTTEDILGKMNILKKYPKINISAPIIIYNPTETKAEVRESVRLALKLMRMHPRFTFGINFYKPLKGTKFFQMSVDLGFKPPENLLEWMYVEHRLVYNVAHSWIPWFDEKEKRNYELALLYFRQFMSRYLRKTRHENRWPIKWIIDYMIELLMHQRLYHWYFGFPVEYWFNKALKKAKVYLSLKPSDKAVKNQTFEHITNPASFNIENFDITM